MIQAEVGWEEICSVVQEKMKSNFKKLPEDQQNTFQNANNYLNSIYEGFLLSEGNTPMYRFFLQYDPSSSLLKTSCPVLLLFGDLDVIHPPDQHMDIMMKALKNGGNNDISDKVFTQTDHDFTTLDSIKKKEFTLNLLRTISDWIQKIGIK